MESKLKEECMDRAGEVQERRVADRRTSLGAAFEEMDNAMAAALDAGGAVAGSLGDDVKFKDLLYAAYNEEFGNAAQSALIAYLDSRSASASSEEMISISDLCALLPGPYYMDPPDGGDTPVMEQLRRMAEDAAKHRASAPSVDRNGYADCCDTPHLCSSVRRCTAKDGAPHPVDAAQAAPGVRQLTAQLHDGQAWTVAEQRAFAQVLAAFPNESSQGIISLGDAWKHGQAYAESVFAEQAAQREAPEDDQRDAAAYRALNTPEIAEFVKGVEREAMHQRARWDAEHDAGKTPEDWFWLLGYLGGKALHAAKTGNNEKALHHTISSAAALLNWHAAILGAHTGMRPGLAQPTDTTKDSQ